jgi:hypothetical protein
MPKHGTLAFAADFEKELNLRKQTVLSCCFSCVPSQGKPRLDSAFADWAEPTNSGRREK